MFNINREIIRHLLCTLGVFVVPVFLWLSSEEVKWYSWDLLNLYNFVSNNPQNFMDPLGYKCCSQCPNGPLVCRRCWGCNGCICYSTPGGGWGFTCTGCTKKKSWKVEWDGKKLTITKETEREDDSWIKDIIKNGPYPPGG